MKKLLCLIVLLHITTAAYSIQSSRDLYDIGLEAFNSGSYSSAELMFRKIVKRDDAYRDRAWYYLSKSIFFQKKYRAAVFEFNSFLTKCRSEVLRVESRYWIGKSYFMINENLKAIEELKRFVSKSKNKLLMVDAYEKLGLIYLKDKRYIESVIEFENAIKISKDRDRNSGLIYNIGTALFASRDFDRAIARISPLIYSGIDAEVKMKLRILLGRIYQEQGNHKKALILFNTVPQKYSGKSPFYNLYYFRALSYNELSKYRKSRYDLDIFSSIATGSEYYYDGVFLLGKIQLQLNNSSAGETILHRVWSESKNPDLQYESALLLSGILMDRSPEKAIVYLKKFSDVKDTDRNKKVLLLLSRAYLKTGKFKECEATVDYFLKNYRFDDNLDEIYFIKARLYLEQGNFTEASAYFNKIKQENPFSKFLSETEYYTALLKYKQKNYKEAARLLEKYINRKDNPNIADPLMILLDIHTKLGNWNSAKKYANLLLNKYAEYNGVDKYIVFYAMTSYGVNKKNGEYFFRKIIKQFPYSENAMLIYQFMGDREYKSGNYKKAIFNYEKFLNSNMKENRGLSFYRLIKSYYSEGRYKNVIGIVERGGIPPLSEKQWKEIPMIHARSYYMLKKYGDVYSLLKYDDISKFNEADALMLIDSLIKIENTREADSFIGKISDKKIKEKSILILSDHYYDTGQFDKSVGFLKKYTKDTEDTGNIRIRLVRSLLRLNDLTAVKELFSKMNSNGSHRNNSEITALKIVYYFKIGKSKTAAELTERYDRLINGSGLINDIYRLNLEYSYNNNDSKKFYYYSRKLSASEKDYVDYMNGKFYFKNNIFKKSYYSLYKLSFNKNKYFNETNYMLGLINLHYYRNHKKALVNFSKITNSEKNHKNYYSVMSKLESARIYSEKKKTEIAKKLLNEIENSDVSSKHIMMARNLKEYYGY